MRGTGSPHHGGASAALACPLDRAHRSRTDTPIPAEYILPEHRPPPGRLLGAAAADDLAPARARDRPVRLADLRDRAPEAAIDAMAADAQVLEAPPAVRPSDDREHDAPGSRPPIFRRAVASCPSRGSRRSLATGFRSV